MNRIFCLQGLSPRDRRVVPAAANMPFPPPAAQLREAASIVGHSHSARQVKPLSPEEASKYLPESVEACKIMQ